MIYSNKKKLAASILLFSILSINIFSVFLYPKKAEATMPTVDWPSLTWEKIGDAVMAGLAETGKIAARKLIIEISQATVDWINNGFNGNPAFVDDFGKFLTGEGGVLDQTVGEFIAQNPDLNFLCDPFRAQVMLALQVGYGSSGNLVNKIGCTFSGVTQNIENAMEDSRVGLTVNGLTVSRSVNDFIDGGGWDAWLQTTVQPQNNQYGVYLIAKSELEAKIETEKGAKTMELTVGQGSLTFKNCVNIYQDRSGTEVGRSESYVDGLGARPEAPSDVRVVQKCDVKTPGATITNMLGFKATSDTRMNEMVGALSDGLDAIFNALIGSLINMAMDQLYKGVLDTDTTNSDTYANALDNLFAQSTENMSNALSDIDNYGMNIPVLYYGSTTWSYPPQVGTSTSGEETQNIIGYSPLAQAQNNALILLNSLSKSEFDYRNNYEIAKNILTEAQKVFATSSACNMSVNRSDYFLRSILIRANVITNIDGTPNSDRNIANIPWNLQVIQVALEDSVANQEILDEAALNVRSASSVTIVTEVMTPVNSTSFNTDPQITMVDNIRTWLRGVQAMYNSQLCPIDLTQVLQINSATSTGI